LGKPELNSTPSKRMQPRWGQEQLSQNGRKTFSAKGETNLRRKSPYGITKKRGWGQIKTKAGWPRKRGSKDVSDADDDSISRPSVVRTRAKWSITHQERTVTKRADCLTAEKRGKGVRQYNLTQRESL